MSISLKHCCVGQKASHILIRQLKGLKVTQEIPFIFESFKYLQHLDLSNNALRGTLHPLIGAMTSLRFLDLSRNRLGGVLPSQLGTLTSLTTLKLSDNGFFGVLPRELGSTPLVRLDVANNRLRGTLPTALSDIASLRLFPGNNGLQHDSNPAFDSSKAIECVQSR